MRYIPLFMILFIKYLIVEDSREFRPVVDGVETSQNGLHVPRADAVGTYGQYLEPGN